MTRNFHYSTQRRSYKRAVRNYSSTLICKMDDPVVAQSIAESASLKLVPSLSALGLMALKNSLKPTIIAAAVIGGASLVSLVLKYAIYTELSLVNQIISVFNQTLQDPVLMKDLVEMDMLNSFNFRAAHNISNLTYGQLDIHQCEVIVK